MQQTAIRILLTGCLMSILAGQASADETLAMAPEHIKQLWRKYMQIYRHKFVQLGHQLECSVTYDPQYENSRHLSRIAWTRGHIIPVRFNTVRSWVHDGKLVPPNEEIDVALKLIPGFSVGHYGHLDSLTVVQILGPDAMLTTAPQLVDPQQVQQNAARDQKALEHWENTQAKQLAKDPKRGQRRAERATKSNENILNMRFRLRKRAMDIAANNAQRQIIIRGVDTSAYQPGMKFTGTDPKAGLQLVIVGHKPNVKDPQKPILEALEGRQFGSGISEQAFEKLLAERGLNPVEFAIYADQVHKEHGDSNAPQLVLKRLGFITGHEKHIADWQQKDDRKYKHWKGPDAERAAKQAAAEKRAQRQAERKKNKKKNKQPDNSTNPPANQQTLPPLF